MDMAGTHFLMSASSCDISRAFDLVPATILKISRHYPVARRTYHHTAAGSATVTLLYSR